jgi:hypothetical protein
VDCLLTLDAHSRHVKGVHTESTEAFRPLLPQWAAHFAAILAAPLKSADADYGLKIVVLQVQQQQHRFDPSFVACGRHGV